MATRIRTATTADAAAIAAIYGPVVRDSATSFELDPPDEAEIARRITATVLRFPWLVFEDEGAVVGYAYAGPFRAREAYRFTAETSVYVARTHHGRGVGRSLMVALLEALRAAGFHTAVAGATLPNAASTALHESLGFVPVGTFREVGYKFEEWRDVGFWSLSLGGAATG